MAETLRKKLLNIQRDLKAPKGQYNNFGKYSYRNAEDIMEALKPLLVDNNTVCYCKDDYVEKVDERYYLVATIVLADVETDEEILVKARAREEETKKGMDGSQITGSASSYARKYALSGLFMIDDNKDADSNEYHQQNNQKQNQSQQPKQQPQQQIILITSQQHDELLAKINHLAQVKGVEFDQVANFLLGKYKVGNFREIPSMSYELVSNNIDNMIKKAEGKINDA